MKFHTPALHRTGHAHALPARRPRRSTARVRPAARPRLEPLESRLALSTITVTSAADAGKGTLRAAIAAAQSGDTIKFSSSLNGQVIALTGGELTISKSLTIQGPGSGKLDVDAGGNGRVFGITSASANVTISGLTISDGSAAQGGGILDQGGMLTLSNDDLSNNRAVGANPGDPGEGGGVAVIDGGTLTGDSALRPGARQQGPGGAWRRHPVGHLRRDGRPGRGRGDLR